MLIWAGILKRPAASGFLILLYAMSKNQLFISTSPCKVDSNIPDITNRMPISGMMYEEFNSKDRNYICTFTSRFICSLPPCTSIIAVTKLFNNLVAHSL